MADRSKARLFVERRRRRIVDADVEEQRSNACLAQMIDDRPQERAARASPAMVGAHALRRPRS